MNYFFESNPEKGFLSRDESIHCAGALRHREGDPISIIDGKGSIYQSVLTKADPRKCLFRIVQKEFTERGKSTIHIAICPTKRIDRMEWFVEKATEIGIDKISLIQSQHAERTRINSARLEKIAISAIKQSQQSWLPEISNLEPLHSFLKRPQETHKFIAEMLTDAQPLIKQKWNVGAVVLIGPEGGFSSEEILTAMKAGYITVTLNEHRLRTETAGLVACDTLTLLKG